MLSWIVHRVCRYVLYVATTFCLSVHPSYINGAERNARNYGQICNEEARSWAELSRFHSLPSAGVIPVDNAFQSQQAPWCHWRPKGIWKGRGYFLLARMSHAFKFWCPQVLSAAILAPCLKSVPASLVWALTTHQIWTNGGRAHRKLCAYAWWLHTCTLWASRWFSSNYSRVAWAASTPSHLLHASSVPNLTSTLFWWSIQLFVFLRF